MDELFAYIFGIYIKFGYKNPSIFTPLDLVDVASQAKLLVYIQCSWHSFQMTLLNIRAMCTSTRSSLAQHAVLVASAMQVESFSPISVQVVA